ncbi:MAG: hypothetical protein ACOC43_15670 [Desulfohalobiaceae bacterium]
MQAIELKTLIDENGRIQVPKKYSYAYGKQVKLVVLLPNEEKRQNKKRQPGSAKGLLKIVAEDKEHLNDFQEYMS